MFLNQVLDLEDIGQTGPVTQFLNCNSCNIGIKNTLIWQYQHFERMLMVLIFSHIGRSVDFHFLL